MLETVFNTNAITPPGGFDIAWSDRDRLVALQLYRRANELGYNTFAWTLVTMYVDSHVRGMDIEYTPTLERRLATFINELHTQQMVAS